MDDKTRRFLWLFLPFGLVIVAIGGYWFSGRSSRAKDRSFAKDHPIGFLAANSAGEAMLQLDACLLQYALVQRDEAYPEDLERLGPDGIRCVNANLTGGPNNLNYRFAYFPAGRDAKEKPHGFLLYAYPLLGRDGKLAPDSTPAEYFANEDGVVLVRKDFGALTEHIEPFLGLPKTLQVLSARFISGKPLPTDQTGILDALGPEGKPGYSGVPPGYQGLWTPADNAAAVVWTNLSEGYLYSYRPEHAAAPTHFTLLARPVHVGIREVDAPIRRLKHYFLNESGGSTPHSWTARPPSLTLKSRVASASARIASDCGSLRPPVQPARARRLALWTTSRLLSTLPPVNAVSCFRSARPAPSLAS